jgi:hypothetical protein
MPLTLERLRVGLHMGTAKEVLDVEGRVNYVGDGINTAKRIQDLAEPGQMVASQNFFDAFAHLDADYSRLFARSGSGNDQHGRSYELFALSFDEEAFSKLSQEMLQNFNNLPPETSPEHQGVGGAFTQVSDFIRKWFIPVNALLFSTTFYISNVGKIANQSLALRYTGLALLVLAVAMGLASWWLLSHRGGRFAARHPRIVNLFRHKPVTLLSLGLGLVLTVGAWVIDQPIGPLQEAKMESPTKVAPVLTEKPVVPSAPVVLANTLPTPRAALPSTVTPLATAIGDSPTVSRSATLPRVAKDGKLLNKVSSFNPRCSTLLQKASAGEPFSPQEQSEMVSTCQ